MAADEEDRDVKVERWLSRTRAALPGVVALFVAALSVGKFGFLNTTAIRPPLTVVAFVAQSAGRVDISGRVLQDGAPVGQALVWAVVDYDKGQHAAPAAAQTDGNGGFAIGPLTSVEGGVTVATVYARKVIPRGWFTPGETLRGQDIVQLKGEPKLQPGQTVPWSPLIVWPMVGVFAASFLLPFFFGSKVWKYKAGVCLALAATFIMIYFVSTGLNTVTTLGRSKDILQLGFASIYRGTYVKDVPPEWLFSFTSPPSRGADVPPQSLPASAAPARAPEESPAGQISGPQAAATSAASPGAVAPQATSPASQPLDLVAVDHGFGAPLWVILVSVLGAGVVTVSLIVDEITKMPDSIAAGAALQPPNAQPANAPAANGEPADGAAASAVDPKLLRGHVQTLVQHQFFILFAPVTAIFVYQALVAGSAASSSLMVGLAALGAGPSLSALLTKAGALATKLFQ